MKRGKALSEKLPINKLGDYIQAVDRADPVSILEEQAKTRIPELVPIRYARMLASPFAFFRGNAAIMAADLAASGEITGIQVQACGDMHIANFGVFASAERNLVFGINDFDETLPGPWEWDLKRLVASAVVSSRFLGGSQDFCRESALALGRSYRKWMRQYANMGNMELWYSTISEEKILESLTPSAQKGAKKIMDKARRQTHLQMLDKLTDLIDDEFRIREYTPLIVRETHTLTGRPIKEAIELFIESYLKTLSDNRKVLLQRYRVVDVVRKIVGVGSVGTRCWVILLVGKKSDDPLFLQIKEAQPSVLAPYMAKSNYSNEGQRVVAGQRLIQGAPDIFLGWGIQNGIHFYVRQLRDMKGGVELDPKKIKMKNVSQYGALCGRALALAHARSGDAAAIAGYIGNSDRLDKALVEFGFAYADQTEKDYQAFVVAAKTGRIKVADAEVEGILN